MNVYRCVACDGFHIGGQMPQVVRGVVARMTAQEQAERLSRTAGDAVVRECPSCEAQGTPRVGVLHAAGCDWSGDDLALPIRRRR